MKELAGISFLLIAGVVAAGALAVAAPREQAGPPGDDGLFPFVLPWDDTSTSVTNVSAWLEKPAGGHGFVAVRDGHLYAGERRLRFFGVNLCFGACFPTHADAEKVAARMAKFGINCVRFHHMDMQSAPGGIFLNVPASDPRHMRALDPGQLDKLDYFIAQLKRHGIYTNLNLHVSRTYPGLPVWEGMPSFHKGVDNFHPRMIALQREYARDLLTHRNPYTGTRYVEEPAVAFIEINNENALLHEWWGGGLDGMPEAYAEPLRRAWNDWLKAKYPADEALRRAWGVREEGLGAELLANGGFEQGTQGWNLEQHAGAQATWHVEREGPDGRPALRVRVRQPGQEGWHVQFHPAPLRLEPGKSYTLTFWAKADAPRRITVNAMQAHAPWQQLWSAEVALATSWRAFQFVFSPAEGDERARVTFSGLGAHAGDAVFAGVSLKPGGVLGLRAGEQLGRIDLFPQRDYGSRTVEARRDWIRFLWQTEEGYWTGMQRFLKAELGARALVIGTQMGYSPFPIQAKLDVIDSHAYWQHPAFPGRAWDPENWSVNNVSMVKSGTGSTLASLAPLRPFGKPFLCTEYNHSAPNTFSSEAFLLLAVYAGLQDWDGLFAFAYSHRRDDWDARRIPSFFDIDQHPAKMATLPAAVALFTRGDVRPAVVRGEARLTLEAAIDRVRQAGPTLRADAFGVPTREALQRRVGLELSDAAPAAAPRPEDGRETATFRSDTGELAWDAGAGIVTVNGTRSKAVIGLASGQSFDLGGITVAPAANRQNWAAIALTALDGRDLTSPGRVLVTATGYAENTGMGWKSPEKSSVGRDWGQAPSRVEGIPATLMLPVPAARVRAWALDERGRRGRAVPVEDAGGKAKIEIGPRYRTLWYEVEVR